MAALSNYEKSTNGKLGLRTMIEFYACFCLPITANCFQWEEAILAEPLQHKKVLVSVSF